MKKIYSLILTAMIFSSPVKAEQNPNIFLTDAERQDMLSYLPGYLKDSWENPEIVACRKHAVAKNDYALESLFALERVNYWVMKHHSMTQNIMNEASSARAAFKKTERLYMSGMFDELVKYQSKAERANIFCKTLVKDK